MAETATQQKTKVLAWSPTLSTRFLLEVSVDARAWDLEFADSEADFINRVKENTHTVYVVDAARAASSEPSPLFKDLSGLVLRHMIRVVAIADKAPEGDFAKMADFGPLSVVSFDTSRARLNRALQAVAAMQGEWHQKRDTGSRVKSDPKFYKEQRFKE